MNIRWFNPEFEKYHNISKKSLSFYQSKEIGLPYGQHSEDLYEPIHTKLLGLGAVVITLVTLHCMIW